MEEEKTDRLEDKLMGEEDGNKMQTSHLHYLIYNNHLLLLLLPPYMRKETCGYSHPHMSIKRHKE